MNLRTPRRVGCLVILSLALPPSALADGGQSIASATPIAVGQQQFGNTANGAQSQGGCADSDKKFRSWWSLDVASGDALTIDWEAQNPRDTYLNLFQVATTDYTFTTVDPVASSSLNDNSKAELKYRATKSGTIPVEFVTDEGCFGEVGPYDFIVYVRHAVILSVPRTKRLPASGKIDVGVHTPDGGPISDSGLVVTLQAKRRKARKYKAIGAGSASNGTATINYTVPSRLRHKKVYLRAIAAGPNYAKKPSSKQKSKAK